MFQINNKGRLSAASLLMQQNLRPSRFDISNLPHFLPHSSCLCCAVEANGMIHHCPLVPSLLLVLQPQVLSIVVL
jgi:hypothetical protein